MPSRVSNLFAVTAAVFTVLAAVSLLTVWPADGDRGGQAAALNVAATWTVAACVCAVGAAVVRRLDR